MGAFSFRLRRAHRRDRRALVQFLDALGLYLLAGFDLAFAWNEAVLSLDDSLSDSLKKSLTLGDGGLTQHLAQLSSHPPLPGLQLWFAVLGELYASGAAMGEAVRAAADSLRADHLRALDEHCRKLPLTGSLVLLLFFLPPALALIFVPLMAEWAIAFAF